MSLPEERNRVEYRLIPGRDDRIVGADGTYWKRVDLKPSGKDRDRIKISLGGRARYLHQLILDAFVGPCPAGLECLHDDGNPLNNRLDNLRWGTKAENQEDSLRHGTMPLGSGRPSAKLREGDIPRIRAMHAEGTTTAAIARAFGVSDVTVYFVLKGRRWKHVVDTPSPDKGKDHAIRQPDQLPTIGRRETDDRGSEGTPRSAEARDRRNGDSAASPEGNGPEEKSKEGD